MVIPENMRGILFWAAIVGRPLGFNNKIVTHWLWPIWDCPQPCKYPYSERAANEAEIKQETLLHDGMAVMARDMIRGDIATGLAKSTWLN